MTSVREVARHARVSVGTVSNVLNRPDRVAPDTRQRVLDAIEELGFVRNEAARQLRSGHSKTIGLVVLDVTNPFFTDVARGAEATADPQGTTVILCNSAEDPEREARHLAMLEELRVQGVLITPVDIATPHIDRLLDHGVPVVLVDRASGQRHRCSVAVDDQWGGLIAVEHLLDQGHHHLGFVGGPFHIRQVADRHRGAERAVAQQGQGRVSVFRTGSLTVAEGRRAGERLLALDDEDRPSAVFCANDLIALGVLQAAVQQGRRVPEDLAIVGYDDIEFAAAAAVPLSSVRQPREQLGRTGAELLAEEIAEPDTHSHRQVVYEPELVIRASSAVRRDVTASSHAHPTLPPVAAQGG